MIPVTDLFFNTILSCWFGILKIMNVGEITGVVHAAGMGTRLGDLTRDTPKALVKIGGRPMVSYAIQLLKALGFKKIVVVGGYLYPQLEEYLAKEYPNVIAVENPEYKDDSLKTLNKSLPHCDGGIFQVDVDFIYPWKFVKQVEDSDIFEGEDVKVMVTSQKENIPADMVKVALVDGKVTEMTKELPNYEHGYIGIFYCPKSKIPELREFVADALKGEDAGKQKVWSTLARYAREKGTVRIADIGEFPCVEIDTGEDLEGAIKYILENTAGISPFFTTKDN